MSIHTDLRTRPRRRRPPQRGLLFGAPLERLPHGTPAPGPGRRPVGRVQPVPVALIGSATPVAPARVAPYGAMAATWPLADRPVAPAAPPPPMPAAPSLSGPVDPVALACRLGAVTSRR